jgi:hypothetical protein
MYEIFPIQESLTLYMNVVTQLQELRQAIYKNLCKLQDATFELMDDSWYRFAKNCRPLTVTVLSTSIQCDRVI